MKDTHSNKRDSKSNSRGGHGNTINNTSNTGRDIRRINGKLYDFTDTHDNKYGGTNNKT